MSALLVICGCSKPATEEKKVEAPAQAPDLFKVKFETSKGDFVVEVHRDWAPRGAQQFYTLVTSHFYDGARFVRVLPNFVVQWGINGNPEKQRLWRELRIPDDPVKETNARGTITFATSGPNSRTTQVFVNLRDNARLDQSGFAPCGRVVSGMEVIDSFYSGYGEGAPRGNGPDQNRIQSEGNAYLEGHFPRLDYVKKAAIEP